MENLINIKTIEKNEHLLKGKVFTEMQINILKNKLQGKQLNSNEKTYYYKFIKPKIKAMMSFFNINEINIQGEDYIIQERISNVIKIIRKLEKKHKNKKIILSGSYLFNKKYNDIDVFIFTKYEKEDYIKGRIHVTFLPEPALNSLFFNSLSQISISNFSYNKNTITNIELNSLLQTYELLINSILNKEAHEKILRDFLLQTELASKDVILNPKQLFDLNKKMSDKNINILSNTLINALILSYNKTILRQKLQRQINDYKKLSQEYHNANNLSIYVNTYREAIKLAS